MIHMEMAGHPCWLQGLL